MQIIVSSLVVFSCQCFELPLLSVFISEEDVLDIGIAEEDIVDAESTAVTQLAAEIEVTLCLFFVCSK